MGCAVSATAASAAAAAAVFAAAWCCLHGDCDCWSDTFSTLIFGCEACAIILFAVSCHATDGQIRAVV